MRNEYRNPEDLLIDSTFQQYCAGNDKASKAYWETWIHENADKQELFDTATTLYYILNGNKKPVDRQLMLLQAKLEISNPVREVSIQRRYYTFKIAATMIMIISVLAFLHYRSQNEDNIALSTFIYSADKGEKKKIILQDGTTVFLNSASQLTVYKNFNGDRREVFLSGEGFF